MKITKGKHYCNRLSYLLVVLLLFFTSCAATTGPNISSSTVDLTKFHKIGIGIKKNEEYSGRFFQELTGDEQDMVVPSLALGVAGILAVNSARKSKDKALADRLPPMIDGKSPVSYMRHKLQEDIQGAKVFKNAVVENVYDGGNLHEKHIDALVEVTLRRWGLLRCANPKKGSSVHLQIYFDLEAKFVSLNNNKIIWLHNEYYKSDDCYPLETFVSHPKLLHSKFSLAIDKISNKIVNGIVYSY